MDQATHTYAIMVRNRKWYWPLIKFVIETAVYNAWLLHRQLPNTRSGKMSHLEFLRDIAKSYLMSYGVARAIPGKKPNVLYKRSGVASRVTDHVRFDKVGHGLTSAPDGARTRCALCHSTTVKMCTKCMVHLHQKCFNAFHGL